MVTGKNSTVCGIYMAYMLRSSARLVNFSIVHYAYISTNNVQTIFKNKVT